MRQMPNNCEYLNCKRKAKYNCSCGDIIIAVYCKKHALQVKWLLERSYSIIPRRQRSETNTTPRRQETEINIIQPFNV
jgi:hypothetical protein